MTYASTGSGFESVTKECQLCTNLGSVRILDTSGFADSEDTKEHGAFGSNLHIFRQVIREQTQHNLNFSCILYFLPTRGRLVRADGVLQDVLQE